jgi:hypothetical protein
LIRVDLQARCSAYFTWRDLIECGETFHRLRDEGISVNNLPRTDESFAALAGLAQTLLDPLRAHFGVVQLTYGFAGPALTKHIARGISPPHDQHAGHEHNASGGRVCARDGQACDLRVPGRGALVVARWIRETLPFDRIYLYGDDRPLHLSFATEPRGAVIAMRPGGRARVPLDVSRRSWDEIAALLAPRPPG